MNTAPFFGKSPDKSVRLRSAESADLDFLVKLEQSSFAPHRRSNRQSLQRSIVSPSQHVIIAEQKRGTTWLPAAAGCLLCYKHSIRLYSIAVSPDSRNSGIGRILLSNLISYAISTASERMTLEVDALDKRLITWYQRHGFICIRHLPNYYASGESALRMAKTLIDFRNNQQRMVVIADSACKQLTSLLDIRVYSPEEYFSNTAFANSNRYHVVNLCNSWTPNSMGYYVSLMANARGHRITPSIMTMRDISRLSLAHSLIEEINPFLQKKLAGTNEIVITFPVIFGKTVKTKYRTLAQKLFSLFDVPALLFTFEKRQEWKLKKITHISQKRVANEYPELLRNAFADFASRRRYIRPRLKTWKYDLAILINDKEATPPSCPAALQKFAKAAENANFYVEFISKKDARRICEFDALFLRETTAVEDHTYTIARQAYTEGLVVIDDPWSILLCSNKVFLKERLENAGILQPKSVLLTKRNSTHEYLASLHFPLVLKLPESSFSQGVFLVNDPNELRCRLADLFSRSAIVIAQQFLQSDYDWRIGILDAAPLFACKYYMANGHWQIYNWKSEQQEDVSGRSEAVAIEDVPAHVIRAALMATSLVGNGLYGVDIKDYNGKAFVIEVNDNPNIDCGIEDELLGDALYAKIMTSLFDRVEMERQQVRYLI